MRGITWVLAALQIITAIAILIVVMLQKSAERDGITGNPGASNSGMGMSRENVLSKWTGILGFLFVVLTIAVSTLMVVDLR